MRFLSGYTVKYYLFTSKSLAVEVTLAILFIFSTVSCYYYSVCLQFIYNKNIDYTEHFKVSFSKKGRSNDKVIIPTFELPLTHILALVGFKMFFFIVFLTIRRI